MPITVESAIKSDKAARTSPEGRKILGFKNIPNWFWYVAVLGGAYLFYKSVKEGDIQSPDIVSPGQPGSTGSH
jgi:hypothetical protein